MVASAVTDDGQRHSGIAEHHDPGRVPVELARGELAKASGRLAGLSERERNAVESLTSQIVNKLLHEPILRLKEAAAAEDRRGPENRVEG